MNPEWKVLVDKREFVGDSKRSTARELELHTACKRGKNGYEKGGG